MSEQRVHKPDGFFGDRVASVRDFHTKSWHTAYDELERYSDSYVDFMVRNGGYDGYPWPNDPMHNFTRVWEYPYVYHQLTKHMPVRQGAAPPSVLDIGSALTFLPAFLTSKGYAVTASDAAPKMETTFRRLQQTADAPPELRKVKYVTSDCRDLRSERSGSHDAVTSVSVLEHVPDLDRALVEAHRLLRPGGMLILTLDLQWDPAVAESETGLAPETFSKMLETCSRRFDHVEPEVAVHPMDVLRYSNHPRHLSSRAREPRARSLLERLQPLGTAPARLLRKVQRIVNREDPYRDLWCVYGMTLRRRG